MNPQGKTLQEKVQQPPWRVGEMIPFKGVRGHENGWGCGATSTLVCNFCHAEGLHLQFSVHAFALES